MPDCPKCGAQCSDSQRFCAECGASLEPRTDDGGVRVTDAVVNRSPVQNTTTSVPVNINVPGQVERATDASAGVSVRELVFCKVCGKRLPLPEWRCPKCEQFVCEEHYLSDQFMCVQCAKQADEAYEPSASRVPAATPEAPSGNEALAADASGLASSVTVRGVEFMLVPQGKFLMGATDEDRGARPDEKPQHGIHLGAYYIAKYPVTVAQYRDYCDAVGSKMPSLGDDFSAGDYPMVNVSWHDALAYCRWLSRVSGRRIMLPTEAQWEKAARGTDGRRYPWGNEEPDDWLCNFSKHVGHTTPVDEYPHGVSPYGCHDMVGNVWEWCSDWYGEDY